MSTQSSRECSFYVWPGWGTSHPEIFPSQAVRFFLVVSVYLQVKALREPRGHYQELKMTIGRNQIFNGLGLPARNGHCLLRKTLHYVEKATEIVIPFDSALSLLGVYPKEMKQLKQNKTKKTVDN